MAQATARILIVEDESLAAMALEELLVQLGHEVCTTVDTADDAVDAADRHRPDLIMMDIRLRGPGDGILAAQEIRSRYGIRSIFTSAFSDPEMRRRADACEPLAFLKKPYFEEELERALKRGLASLRGG